MDTGTLKILIFLAMAALPVAFFFWSRRRRPPGMDPEAAWRAMKAGAPMTGEMAAAIGAYTARNARPIQGVVEHVFSQDKYGVHLEDGRRITATRSSALWRHGMVFSPGHRVQLLVIPGDDSGLITATA